MKKKKKSKIPLSALYNRTNYEDIVKDLLVDFSTLIDTDLAVIAYLLDKYPKSKFFLEECKNWTVYFTKCKVLTRKDINPVTVILKDDYQDQADNLYNELLETKWKEVINIAPVTDILNLLGSTYDYAGYVITVKCRNEAEEKYIKERFKDWKTLIGKENTNSYSTFFIHDLQKRAEELLGVGGKAIYIYYHNPNFLNFKQGVLKEYAAGILNNNVKLIEPYKGMVLPYDMTPDDLDLEVNYGKEYSTKRDQSCDEHCERDSAS